MDLNYRERFQLV